MKKFLAMLLALAMIFALAACGGGGETKEEPAEEEVSADLAGTYDVTIWVADAAVDLTKQQIEDFNKTNEFGIVINASKVKLTGDAEHKKNYYNVSEWNGGLRTRSAGVMKREYPVELIERCVWGMLPKGPLGRAEAKKLFVYADEKHGQEAQKPVALDLSK